MDHELGSVTPGKCADIVLLDSLEQLNVTATIIDGALVAQDGEALFPLEPFAYPQWVTQSMHLGLEIAPETFAIAAPEGATDGSTVTVRAMEVASGKVPDEEVHVALTVQNGQLHSSVEQDVLKTFVFERHHETGTFGMGFTKGFGIKRGAMASTVAHDAHNLLVVGTNDADMALAANTLARVGGGMVAVADGEVLGLVELPIAGLMAPLPAEEMSHKVHHLEQTWEKIGCTMASPFMTMALIPLACLPQLRLTNRGLVDCTTFQFTSLFVEEDS